MKLSLLSLAFAASASLATPIEHVARSGSGCKITPCLIAVKANPFVGYPFCYSKLGRIVTSTKYKTTYTLTTTIVTETVATNTEYTATITTLTVATEALQKRTWGHGTAIIIKACQTNSAKISSACSCLLKQATSTTTITLTTMLPSVVTETVPATATETASDPFTITSTCYPSATPIITNGGFESGTLDPWYLVPLGSDSSPGTYTITTDVTAPEPSQVFDANLSIRPPGFTFTKVIIAQNLVTCPGVTYTISFFYKIVTTGPAVFLVGFVGGVDKFYHTSSEGIWQATSASFTATSTTTVFQLDLVRGDGTGTANIFIDGVTVTIG